MLNIQGWSQIFRDTLGTSDHLIHRSVPTQISLLIFISVYIDVNTHVRLYVCFVRFCIRAYEYLGFVRGDSQISFLCFWGIVGILRLVIIDFVCGGRNVLFD